MLAIRMKISLLFTICLFAFQSEKSQSEELITPPDGWRFPTEKELSDIERKESNERFAATSGDFNGDGAQDQAFLFKSTEFSGQGLLVRLSDTSSGYRWLTLDKVDWGPDHPDVNLLMGIETLPPRNYEYICMEVGTDCAVSVNGSLLMDVRNSSILYFRFASAESMFFWDAEASTFVRLWLSD